MKGQLAFEALGMLPDDLIVEAAGQLGFWGDNTPAIAPRRREKSALSRFFGSGWGVALICAVVSISVLGGVIWAGQRPASGPAGSQPSETETTDYAGTAQDEVAVKHGDTVIYPQKFFLWSNKDEGMGFAREVELYHGNQPSLPKLRYAGDGSISPCELTMGKKYEFSSVRVYDTDMQHATAYNYDGEFVYGDFLKSLEAGRYYVVMEIRSRSSGYEYAFELEVFDLREDTTTEEVTDGASTLEEPTDEEVTTDGEVTTASEETTDSDVTSAEPISKERAKEIASDYWGKRDGDRSPNNGFEFRIECRDLSTTSRGEEVYVVLLRWQVMPYGHWSTVDMIWVEFTTGFLLEFSCFTSSLLHSISERILSSVVLLLRTKERI